VKPSPEDRRTWLALARDALRHVRECRAEGDDAIAELVLDRARFLRRCARGEDAPENVIAITLDGERVAAPPLSRRSSDYRRLPPSTFTSRPGERPRARSSTTTRKRR